MDKNQIGDQAYSSSTTSQNLVNAEGKEISPSNQQRSLKSEVYLSELVGERAQLVLNLVGYGLLIFSLFNYLHILIPPHFTNFIWEFQTIGALVEYVATPLLGLAVVFYRPQSYIGELERKFLGCLSWISLLLGVLYLLMLPLGIMDTWRIYNANKAEVSAQVSQQSQPLQQLKTKLDVAKTDQQLMQIFASLTPEGRTPRIKQPQKVKEQLLTKISRSQQNIQAQADAVGATNRQVLLKNSLKWNLGALVAGTLFILIWRLTDWTRIRQY